MTSGYYYDFSHSTMTFDLRPKIAENQGHRSNGSAVRAQTNEQMDVTESVISLLR